MPNEYAFKLFKQPFDNWGKTIETLMKLEYLDDNENQCIKHNIMKTRIKVVVKKIRLVG